MSAKHRYFVGYVLRLRSGGKLSGGIFVAADSGTEAMIRAKHALADEHGKGHRIVLKNWGRFNVGRDLLA